MFGEFRLSGDFFQQKLTLQRSGKICMALKTVTSLCKCF